MNVIMAQLEERNSLITNTNMIFCGHHADVIVLIRRVLITRFIFDTLFTI